MKYTIRLLLPEFSYNASSKRFGVIVHKDHPVIQWIIIKMGYNVYSKHVIVMKVDFFCAPSVLDFEYGAIETLHLRKGT
jgi:hypothetical protein